MKGKTDELYVCHTRRHPPPHCCDLSYLPLGLLRVSFGNFEDTLISVIRLWLLGIQTSHQYQLAISALLYFLHNKPWILMDYNH